jgi:predicted negative regulator of RcsB-dependent stress response
MALAVLIILVLASSAALMITDHVRKEHKPERKDASALDYVNTFISTLYMVLLALVVVVQWQNIDQINADVRTEASTLTALVQTADRMPGAEGAEVRASAFAYAHGVLGDEWPSKTAEQAAQDAAQRALDAGQAAVTHPVALDASLGTIEDQAIGEFQTLAQARADRLAVGEDTTSPVLLAALGVLSLITVLTPLALGLRADAVAFAGLTVSTLLVCLSFWFVLDLQTLYHGLIHVTSGPIQTFVASGGVH